MTMDNHHEIIKHHMSVQNASAPVAAVADVDASIR